MAQVKSWASDSVSEEVNDEEPDMSGINESEPEEEEPEPEPEPEPEDEEEDEAPSLDFGGGGDDDEEEEDDSSIISAQDESNIESELDTLVEHKEEIAEFDEDDERWNDVAKYILEQLDLAEEEEVFNAVKDHAVDYVLEDEEEDEEEDDTEGNLFG